MHNKSMKLIVPVALSLSSLPCVAGFSCGASPVTFSRCSVKVFGILDEINSESFNLLGDITDKDEPGLDKAYESFLAQLVFSANDPRLDIIDNIDLCSDPVWLNWLDNKITTTTDIEEKVALRDLYEMISDIVKRIELSKQQEEREAKIKAEADAQRLAEEAENDGRSMSNADVLRKASAVDRSGLGEAAEIQKTKVSFYDQELTPEIRMSYDDMVKKVLPPYKAGDTPNSIVFAYYDQFDAQFIKVLKERAENGEKESQDILEALSIEQSKRMTAATENIKQVLAAGDPMRMEGVIVKLAKQGKVDEPFLLLLEANANQAAAAGATGPAQLMKRLGKRASEEKDKQSQTKEIRLLRQLLRAESQDERENLLTEAFTPKTQLLVEGNSANAMKAMDGELPDQEKPKPDVPPPDFINACKAVLLNFGNLSFDDDRGDLSTRIKAIASEAEVVATRIYGKGMTVKEQQDRMWREKTTSIFDLETLEIEAERRGETAPWTNPNNDDILPGFDKDGKMRIGG
jgi:hypothetical protein